MGPELEVRGPSGPLAALHHVWGHVGPPFLRVLPEGDGYPRSTGLSWVAVAMAVSAHIAPRVPESGNLQRDAPAANSFRLCGVLQSSAHALGITERGALASSSPTDLAPLSRFRSWLDCTTNTSGYDFRKGQVNDCRIAITHAAATPNHTRTKTRPTTIGSLAPMPPPHQSMQAEKPVHCLPRTRG